MSSKSSLLFKNILEAIPFDDWVSSRDISGRVGIRPQRVGIIIRNNFLNIHVERKKKDKSLVFVYRRLPKLKHA